MHILRRNNTQRAQPIPWAYRSSTRQSHDATELITNLGFNESARRDSVATPGGKFDALSPQSATSSARGLVAADAWMDCAIALKDHDSAKIQGWKEEIDTHLVFAGLFSAILTALNVEAYKLLQPQDTDTTNLLLCSLIATSNNTAPAPEIVNVCRNLTVPSTRPSGSALRLNALWFSSLICSLASASISILVKQWLNEYSSGLASVSPEIARVRQFRYDNLKKWRVEPIMMLLPILLQGALVLFLIGLVDFLNPLDMTGPVTIAASILIGALLFFILVTAILPTFNPDCSYQSPQAWGVFVVVQTLKKPLRSVSRSLSGWANGIARTHADGPFHRFRSRLAKKLVQKLHDFANKPNTYSWKARERVLVEDKGAILDQHLLAGADRTFLDNTFLRQVVAPCLKDMPPSVATECYYEVMTHRADRVVDGVPYFDNVKSRAEYMAILTDITLDALTQAKAARLPIVRILHMLEPLLVQALPLTYPHFCRVLFPLISNPTKSERHLAFAILYQQLSRNLELAKQHSSTGCHDFAAILSFISGARADNDVKLFLDGCDLVICLALSSTDNVDGVRETLGHLQDFFRAPLNDASLLYPISRIAPHLVALERRYPNVLEDGLIDVLDEVVLQHAKRLNYDGNWEDMLIILGNTLEELRAHRLRRRTEERPPSIMSRPSMRSLVLRPLGS